METREKVIEILSECLGVENIKGHEHLEHDLGADSLDKFELVHEFEDEFDIDITDQEAATVLTVPELVNFITAKILAKNV